MNIEKNVLFVFILLLIVLSNNIRGQSLSAEKIYDRVSPTVVKIYAYDYDDSLAKQGSGIILNNMSYLVTNYHIISGCERLVIE